MSLSQCDRDLSRVLSVLMPHLAGLVVEGLEDAGERVLVRARPAADLVPCPGCGVLSGKRHDGYARFLRDLPVWGRQVAVRLQVRVLYCVNPGCARKTFAGQVEGLTSAQSRRTPLLAGALEAVAKVLAGRAGSALAGQLGMPASRHSMIRLVLALPEEDVVTAPGVLGIDDFAFKRGRAYGTVLIGMESGQVTDVLPDRETGTVKKWLEDHPGAAVICRDRGTGYGSACSQGAPDAIQVADRWHLLHNLSDRVRKSAAAALAGHQHDDRCEQPGEQGKAPPPAQPEPSRAAEVRRLHAEVRRLRDAGYSKTAIARELGICVPTVRKYATAATAAEIIPARQPSAAGPYKDHLIRRWDEGARDARALAAEITRLGYQGSDQQVRRYLQPWRDQPGTAPPAAAARRPRHRPLDHDQPAAPDRRRRRRAGRRHRQDPPHRRHHRPGPVLRRHRRRPHSHPHQPRHREGNPGNLAAGRRGSRLPPARLLRQRHPPGLRRRPQRPVPALEQRQGRGNRHQAQENQAPGLRTRQLRPPPQAHPRRQPPNVTIQRYATEPLSVIMGQSMITDSCCGAFS